MKAKFQVTAAEDGLVIWPAETELWPDRDGTYFDPDCKARGDVCGYDMHLVLAGLVDASRGLKAGIYEIEVELVGFKPK